MSVTSWMKEAEQFQGGMRQKRIHSHHFPSFENLASGGRKLSFAC